MEGNVIERRTSSAQLWGDTRQMTLPSETSTSLTTTPVSATAAPPYSNIFVTPTIEFENPKEIEKSTVGASKLSQIKDKHDGET